jgi:SurA N-terminal domain
MIKVKVVFLSLMLTLSSVLIAQESFLYSPEDNMRVVVNNRILAKVNGKAISVFDVMKKMDMLFYRQFPEYISSNQARFQFYSMNWKRVLQDLIDKELIMADAEESKMKVSSGDVRQEMEHLFGPSIHANLDKAGIGFEEAYKMIHSDIVLKRMLYLRANLKALKQVTPQVMRNAYEEYAKTNIEPARWTYTLISIRDKDPTKGAEAAHQAHKLLTVDQLPLNELKKKMNHLASVSTSTNVNVAEEVSHEEKELSQLNKEILLKLTPGAFSDPIAQKSRQDGSTVFRIFFLKEHVPERVVSFDEVATKLKDTLLDEASSKETQLYLKKLHKHFDVQENLEVDEDFKPFALAPNGNL